MNISAMKHIYIIMAAVAALLFGSCTNDLDQKPVYGTNSGTVYSTLEGYGQVLAKIYSTYSLIGNQKAGGADIGTNSGYDLMRCLFNLQESPTDEVAQVWLSGENQANLSDMSWDANDVWVSDTYYRLYYSIALCNEFLRYCTPDAISGFTADEQAEIRHYAAEARFMRAFSYYWVLDLFGQGPFVNEDTPTAGYVPEGYDDQQLFDFVKSEIDAIEADLVETNQYGRAGKAAAWALGSRLCLNAERYTGTSHASDVIAYAKKVMALPYTLESDYFKLFNADNDKRTNEILFAFVADQTNAVTWGSATYFCMGGCSTDATAAESYGLKSTGWGNFRFRGAFSSTFGEGDLRGRMWTTKEGTPQEQYITGSLETDTYGYWPMKWTNLNDAGEPYSDTNADGCDIDNPAFRLAEVYLNAAEAVLRGGQGMSRSEAIALVNLVRTRAYGNSDGNITDAQFNLPFMLEERGRELYHEYQRRSDLIRFNAFTTADKMWEWKGGVVDGRAVDARYNVYPIPATEISANPNLKNPLY